MNDLVILEKSEIMNRLERMDISADAKVLLGQVADKTLEVGGRVIHLGRQILSFIIDLMRQYPNTVFGVLVGFVLSMLVSSVALVGAALGALLGPLLVALGLGIGAVADIENSIVRAKIEAFKTELHSFQSKNS